MRSIRLLLSGNRNTEIQHSYKTNKYALYLLYNIVCIGQQKCGTSIRVIE